MAEVTPREKYKQRATYGQRWQRRTLWTFAVLATLGVIARARSGSIGVDLALAVLVSLVEASVIALVLALLPPHGRRSQRDSHARSGRRANVMALVLGGASLLVIADWTARIYEYNQLLGGMESSESEMADWQKESESVAVSVGTAQPELTLTRISDACSSSASGLQSSASSIRAIHVFPWHVELSEARTAYLSHSLAWEKHLRACASDVRELVNPAASAEITATFRASGAAMQLAEPLLAPAGDVDRRRAMFVK